jgi:HD-like signal output (HDOD) protein
MVVASDVVTEQGRVILQRGKKVESFHLQLLKGLCIEAVEIEAPSGDSDREEQAAAYARDFFAFVNPDSQVMIELFRFATGLVGARLAEGWIPPSLSERRAQNVEQLEDVFPVEFADPARIVAHETELTSFPDIYFKLKEEAESPKASVRTLTDLVSRDMGLTAKLLKLANSPLYGLPESVESIERAIAIIGIQELSTLALGITAINYFHGIPPELVDMRRFWRHSISTGLIAKIIANAIGEMKNERFFIAGLLHDCGRLILFKKLPYASTEALLYARENFVPIVEAERTVFEFTHTDLSTELLANWQFPKHIAELINFHHNPQDGPDPRLNAVVHVADIMANAVDIAADGMYVLPPFDEAAWNALGLPPSAVGRVMTAFETEVMETMRAFV